MLRHLPVDPSHTYHLFYQRVIPGNLSDPVIYNVKPAVAYIGNLQIMPHTSGNHRCSPHAIESCFLPGLASDQIIGCPDGFAYDTHRIFFKASPDLPHDGFHGTLGSIFPRVMPSHAVCDNKKIGQVPYGSLRDIYKILIQFSFFSYICSRKGF